MASHTHVLRWWRSTCRLCRHLLRSRNFSSPASASALSNPFLPSCQFDSSNSRVSSGLACSRNFRNGLGALGMSPWRSGGVRHVSIASRESITKPVEEMTEGITLTDNCIRRILEIKREDGREGENEMLRLSVEGGGCSGFFYNFALSDKVNKDDRVFERDGAKLVVDDISFGFIKGATVDFTEELIRASFAVTMNPNAAFACGCGASFNAK